MNKHICRMIVLICVGGALASAAAADPPKVVKATPDNGDADVDPALTDMRVEFDQEMSQTGHSICGSGPAFPTITARPTWKDKRTIVVPVTLLPDHQYHLMINCPAAQNFRSAAGEPAEIYPISFKTRKAKEPSEPRLSPEDNRKAVEALRKAIDEDYAYRDLRKVDWRKAFDEWAPKFAAADTPAAFARAAASLLEKAKDLHVTVHVGDQVLGTHRRAVTPNVRKETLAKVVPGFKEQNEVVWTGRFDDGIGYINITTWGPEDAKDLDAVYAALDDMADAKGLIVDVRFNSGGDEILARNVATCFVKRKAVYSRNTYRDASAEGGFTKPLDREVAPPKDRKPFAGKVALLMGIANMSSCESFLMMMKTASSVRTFGQKSYGSSGNPKPHELGSDITVYLSSWQDIMPGGQLLEGNRVTPDVEVKSKPPDFEKDDPVIKAALAWLRG